MDPNIIEMSSSVFLLCIKCVLFLVSPFTYAHHLLFFSPLCLNAVKILKLEFLWTVYADDLHCLYYNMKVCTMECVQISFCTRYLTMHGLRSDRATHLKLVITQVIKMLHKLYCNYYKYCIGNFNYWLVVVLWDGNIFGVWMVKLHSLTKMHKCDTFNFITSAPKILVSIYSFSRFIYGRWHLIIGHSYRFCSL